MSIQSNFPNTKPSLLLDFSNTRQLDSRVTFTRSTLAVYYDGKTTAMAEQNLLSYSQQFDNGYWSKTGATVTADSTTAPDGTTTADTINGTVGSYNQYVQISNPSTVGIDAVNTYTYSLYLKAGTISSVRVYIYNGSTGAAFYGTFNLTAITGVAAGTATTPTISIVDVGNSWRRITVTGSLNGSAGQYAVPTIYADNGNFYAWGFQAEQRSSATAYTATTIQAITNYIPVLLTAGGNQPRFDCNPTTGESLGLLIEEQRTNLVVYSQEFDNASWGKPNATITANQLIAPDGTLTAEQYGYGSVAGDLYQSRSKAATATTYTLSVYAKAGSATSFNVYISDNTTGQATGSFNLSTGAVIGVSTGTWTNASATITPVGNGWYRCTVTATSPANTGLLPGFNNMPVNTSLFLWGAQLEAGAFATSYIPTTSASATRAQDLASMTGTNFSSWFNNAQGTLYCEFLPSNSVNYPQAAIITDGTTANTIQLDSHSPGLRAYIIANNQVQLELTTTALTGNNKGVVSYLSNNSSATFNNSSATTDTSCLIPVVNQLGIGSISNVNNNFLNSTIKKIAYYPLRVTNAQMQALTS